MGLVVETSAINLEMVFLIKNGELVYPIFKLLILTKEEHARYKFKFLSNSYYGFLVIVFANFSAAVCVNHSL